MTPQICAIIENMFGCHDTEAIAHGSYDYFCQKSDANLLQNYILLFKV